MGGVWEVCGSCAGNMRELCGSCVGAVREMCGKCAGGVITKQRIKIGDLNLYDKWIMGFFWPKQELELAEG